MNAVAKKQRTAGRIGYKYKSKALVALTSADHAMLRAVVSWMACDPHYDPPRFSPQEGLRYALRRCHANPPAHVLAARKTAEAMGG